MNGRGYRRETSSSLSTSAGCPDRSGRLASSSPTRRSSASAPARSAGSRKTSPWSFGDVHTSRIRPSGVEIEGDSREDGIGSPS
jgi:hypothetical protein